MASANVVLCFRKNSSHWWPRNRVIVTVREAFDPIINGVRVQRHSLLDASNSVAKKRSSIDKAQMKYRLLHIRPAEIIGENSVLQYFSCGF